ncbi:MAG: poly-gamma-glutamate synthase PgsB [Candidatus Aminicenantales bacterium]
MKMLLVPSLCLVFFLLYLCLERAALKKSLNHLPLRICVTGTRGKSTVTRLIAAALREEGYRVLAKTTGSKPVLIFPDGAEREIGRSGRPSILEQKEVLKSAFDLRAGAIVVEMMSIRPEMLKAESEKLLKPRILAVTNVRLDHMDDMGRTKEEIAASLAAAVPHGGALIVPEEEFYFVFEKAAEERETRIIKIPTASGSEGAMGREFTENINLALAVAEYIGVPKDTALRGMARARSDFGGLKIWRTTPDGANGAWYLANAFAANEPESTQKALALLREKYPQLPLPMIALLNLREDRGDRTRQWLGALRAGFFEGFARLIIVGDHARALGHKRLAGPSSKTKVSAWPERRPQIIMDELFALERDGGAVIGMGNMGGLGQEIVDHWARIGVVL